MNTDAIITGLEAAMTTQLAMADGDQAVEEAAGLLLSALRPAVRAAVFELAEQAAAEVGAQLPSRTVEVVISDGDPTLRVVDASASPATDEDFDARLTLRLPPSLKGIVEDAAGISGDSVNAWVVNALARAGRSRVSPNKVKGTFDL